jgi:hypothetical protein
MKGRNCLNSSCISHAECIVLDNIKSQIVVVIVKTHRGTLIACTDVTRCQVHSLATSSGSCPAFFQH